MCGIMAVGLLHRLALWSMVSGEGWRGFGFNGFMANDAAIPNGLSL
jgi:hypothetical protein